MTNFFKGSGQGIVNATYSNKHARTTAKLKPEQVDGEMAVNGYITKAGFPQHPHDSTPHGTLQMICD